MRHSRLKTFGFVITLCFVLATGAIGNAAGGKKQDFGDATVLATVPTPPGFPEGIAVHGNLAYVAGPATFGTAGDGQPSRVISFNLKNRRARRHLRGAGRKPQLRSRQFLHCL